MSAVDLTAAVNVALERVDGLISVANRRILPLALQRLTITDILSDSAKIFQTSLPNRQEVRVPPNQDASFTRLSKYLTMHQPTGYEQNDINKRAAVLYVALRTILQECRDIKLPEAQESAVGRLLEWFEVAQKPPQLHNSSSTPSFDIKMSPKKPITAPAGSPLGQSRSQESIGLSRTSDEIAVKLEKYRMPNLRASHIRRITELRSRGSSSPLLLADEEGGIEFDILQMEESFVNRNEFDYHHGISQHRATSAQLIYQPETEVEREMYELWAKNRKEEEETQKKEVEVRERLKKWSINKSRDESEYLRKHEASKLAAGLGQMYQEMQSPQCDPNSNRTTWSTPEKVRKNHSPAKAQTNHPQTGPKDSPGSFTPTQAGSETPQGTERSSSRVSGSVTKKKSISTSGGMHFRNQLPPNYTPSRGSVTKNEILRGKNSFDDTIQLELPPEEEEESNDGRQQHQNESIVIEKLRPVTADFKFQPFHIPFPTIVRNDSKDFNKGHIKGTIPSQQQPTDPEFKLLYEATISRKPPVPPSTAEPAVRNPCATNGKYGSKNHSIMSSKSAFQHVKATRATGSGSASPDPAHSKILSSSTPPPPAEVPLSDLRKEQEEELDRIRKVFEMKRLPFSKEIFERALCAPQDRETGECVRNLPIAGSKLMTNPLLEIKIKAGFSGKKTTKKKKKGKKKGTKSGSGKPKKKKRSKINNN